MIEAAQLTKTYAGYVQALAGVDLKIGGGLFGLVGPNGAGKTTLMRILVGLLRPTSGRVTVLGQDMTTAQGKQIVKSTLGYLPQELGLYPDLSAREYLDYVGVLKNVSSRAERRQQIDDLLEQVGLPTVADRRLRTYSGGMKRRVGFAQALLGNPQLLIMDEPTAGLDPEERLHLLNLLSDMARQRTVILSTHMIDDVSQRCNDLAVLYRGRVVFRGDPRDLIAHAQESVWSITLPAEDKPDADLVIVSTRATSEKTVQYRVVGKPSPASAPHPVEPNLEDAYLWLMKASEITWRP